MYTNKSGERKEIGKTILEQAENIDYWDSVKCRRCNCINIVTISQVLCIGNMVFCKDCFEIVKGEAK